MKKLGNSINILKDDLVKSIQDLISIKSVQSKAQDKMPFGKGVDDALRFTLNLGKEMGFKTFYGDGYYGYIETGEGEELIGILAHLDVVPVENPNNWTYPPFEGIIHNNRLYGRGSIDDKGPLLAALYAMKAVKDSGVKLNKRIRLILGTNEETDWKGINKYLQLEEIPSCGFTPDANFPLINAEKGLLQVKISSKENNEFILKGGGALNSVADTCTYEGSKIEKLKNISQTLSYEFQSSNNFFKTIGKSTHSAKADLGINAIGRMALVLKKENIRSSIIDFLANEIGEDYNGKNIFGNLQDDASGKITVNIGKIDIDNKKQEFYLDIRYPVTKKKYEILALLKNKTTEYNFNIGIVGELKPLYLPADHTLVKILRDVFEEVTGLDSTPISSGGATYARALDNCVAFGTLFPGKPKLAHQDDEYIDLNDLMKSTLIYFMAIKRIGS